VVEPPVVPPAEPVPEVPLVEPVLLVGAVVLVPEVLPLVASSERRLHADRLSAEATAATRTVKRITEVDCMRTAPAGL
jgi:hypothetical protein